MCDGAYELVAPGDVYLRYLRYSRERALGTSESTPATWRRCARRGLELIEAGRKIDEFVLMLRSEPVTRRGSGVGHSRSSNWRINRIPFRCAEMYKSALAHRLIGEDRSRRCRFVEAVSMRGA